MYNSFILVVPKKDHGQPDDVHPDSKLWKCLLITESTAYFLFVSKHRKLFHKDSHFVVGSIYLY